MKAMWNFPSRQRIDREANGGRKKRLRGHSQRLEHRPLPKSCILFFGQEGSGMSEEAVAICEVVLAIEQYGSTRSINASAAGAIAMYAWGLQHLSPENGNNNIGEGQ